MPPKKKTYENLHVRGDNAIIESMLSSRDSSLTIRELELARLISYDAYSEHDLAQIFSIGVRQLRLWMANPAVITQAERLRLEQRIRVFCRTVDADRILDKSIKVHDQLLDKALNGEIVKDSKGRKHTKYMSDSDKMRLMTVGMDRHQGAQFVKRSRVDISATVGHFDGRAIEALKRTPTHFIDVTTPPALEFPLQTDGEPENEPKPEVDAQEEKAGVFEEIEDEKNQGDHKDDSPSIDT